MMITVQAASCWAIPLSLVTLKIRKENMEIIRYIGTCAFLVGAGTQAGPFCRVGMTSGAVLYINATSEELEARSA